MNYNMGLYRELRSNKFKSFCEGINFTQMAKKGFDKDISRDTNPTMADFKGNCMV